MQKRAAERENKVWTVERAEEDQKRFLTRARIGPDVRIINFQIGSISGRGVTIPALDPPPESDFNSFWDLGSRKKWICNSYRGVMIPSPDLDPELDS